LPVRDRDRTVSAEVAARNFSLTTGWVSASSVVSHTEPHQTPAAHRPEIDDSRRAIVRADNPDSPSLIRITVRSPRCSARKSNTSAATTSSGSLPTTPKNVFRSCATARSVLARARPATNAR